MLNKCRPPGIVTHLVEQGFRAYQPDHNLLPIVDGVVRATLYVTLPGEGTILGNAVSTGLLGVGDAQ